VACLGAIAVMLAWIAATAVVILRFNPGPAGRAPGTAPGGQALGHSHHEQPGPCAVGALCRRRLDQRYGWTGGLPLPAQIAALIVCVLAMLWSFWATASNAFFSQIVRVQSERGHAVATGGPVPHRAAPAYLGAIAYELGAPVLLASGMGLNH